MRIGICLSSSFITKNKAASEMSAAFLVLSYFS